MAGNKAMARKADRKELEEDIHLVLAPESLRSKKEQGKEKETEKVRVLAEDPMEE